MDDRNRFRREFKHFKRKLPPPNYEKVIDFSNIDHNHLPEGLKVLTPQNECYCGVMETSVAALMKPTPEWNMYEIIDKPGLIFIKNPFTSIGQRYWICRSLQDFTRKPHLLNLDGHKETHFSEDWWKACQRKDEYGKILSKKLRWATMGYHHNWNTKVYSDTSKDPFPEDLAALSSYVAKISGFVEDFRAEAGIVNFYHFDSTLSGHTDHSEIDLSAPLLSFSFGQTAIFLLGGPELEETPLPLFIQSGDIVIMSGYSRKCYHGIPKVLPASDSPWEIESQTNVREMDDLRLKHYHIHSPESGPTTAQYNCSASESALQSGSSKQHEDEICIHFLEDLFREKFWEPFREYINYSRINMNVRQVLPKGCYSL